jgi:hypothetical protein
MTGNDIQFYKIILEKVKYLGMTMETKGDCIILLHKKLTLGAFSNVQQTYQYLCGYETGRSHGVNQKRKA